MDGWCSSAGSDVSHAASCATRPCHTRLVTGHDEANQLQLLAQWVAGRLPDAAPEGPAGSLGGESTGNQSLVKLAALDGPVDVAVDGWRGRDQGHFDHLGAFQVPIHDS